MVTSAPIPAAIPIIDKMEVFNFPELYIILRNPAMNIKTLDIKNILSCFPLIPATNKKIPKKKNRTGTEYFFTITERLVSIIYTISIFNLTKLQFFKF